MGWLGCGHDGTVLYCTVLYLFDHVELAEGGRRVRKGLGLPGRDGVDAYRLRVKVQRPAVVAGAERVVPLSTLANEEWGASEERGAEQME